MQTVRQLDQDDTDILGHGQKHLTQIFRLYLQLIRRIAQLPQLCNAIYQKSDLRAEDLRDLFVRHDRIFHNIVQDTCHDRLLIHLQICQNDRYAERMDDVRLPGLSELSFMGILGDLIGLFDHTDIIGRMIFAHTGDQLVVELLRAGKIIHGLDAFFRFFDLSFFLFSRQVFCSHSLFSVRRFLSSRAYHGILLP